MARESTASRRARYAAKKSGTFVDRRLAKKHIFPKPTPATTYLRTDFVNYIHHMTREKCDDWLLKTWCTNTEDGTSHLHYLRRLSVKAMRAVIHHHVARSQKNDRGDPGHVGKAHRKRFHCFNHFLNVIHYLRCRKAQSKDCEHYRFRARDNQFPECNGNCADYRKQLANIYHYKHDEDCPVPACRRWYIKMVLPFKRDCNV